MNKGPRRSICGRLVGCCWSSICRMRVRASRLPGSMPSSLLGRTLSTRSPGVYNSCMQDSRVFVFGRREFRGSHLAYEMFYGKSSRTGLPTFPTRAWLTRWRGGTARQILHSIAASVEQLRAPVHQCNCTSATQPGQHRFPTLRVDSFGRLPKQDEGGLC